jgi:hypothetical protein
VLALPAGATPSASAPAAKQGCSHPVAVVDAAAPVGTGSCPGVRPGALVRIPRPDVDAQTQYVCTLNFRFRGVDRQGDTHAYMGTAGHCILGEGAWKDVTERVWPLGGGPPVLDADRNQIGEFAYAVRDDLHDFALVRLFGGVAVNPEMCHFGGPTGWNLERTQQGRQLRHYGQGVGVSAVAPARTALSWSMRHEHWVYANGVVVPGDSGGPVISTDGRAVGLVVNLGVHARVRPLFGSEAAAIGIVRLRPPLNRAARAFNQYIFLQTADLR